MGSHRRLQSKREILPVCYVIFRGTVPKLVDRHELWASHTYRSYSEALDERVKASGRETGQVTGCARAGKGEGPVWLPGHWAGQLYKARNRFSFYPQHLALPLTTVSAYICGMKNE